MKRDPALVTLSHDHHQALFVAQRLRRATDTSAAEDRAALLAFWNEHGRAHFRSEEDVLLPAFAAHGDPFDPLVARALCEHVEIRARVAAIVGRTDPQPEELRELGERLAAHVRGEERELFPLVEHTMPAPALADLAQALEAEEEGHGDG